MSIYICLFCLGFANDATLTAYYVHAAKGHRWRCVTLALLQQGLAIGSSYWTLATVSMGSREQFIRWGILALSYGFAAAWVVKPLKAAEVKS